jgi:hypothetical protein
MEGQLLRNCPCEQRQLERRASSIRSPAFARIGYANGGEVDLCDEEGKAFWNTCWSLTDPDTVGRERRAMALGRSRAKQAKGILLYHEFFGGLKSALPEAKPAWRWLLEQRKK